MANKKARFIVLVARQKQKEDSFSLVSIYIYATYNSHQCLKVGSEYDASPRRKRDAEIEMDPIHAFGCCVTRMLSPCTRLHHIVNRP